ncbi:putative Rpc11-DNA-directed RNA polymerase III subunit C11 [Acaromyces ingoldii]|uniref:DNA-directed RNA polymerase subunit n=1 Tax=Acaromyces ingoldii TaxID=215250 RepID=A0A316YL84_9BASI|nr:putative Rpc11-DNA-directed RNA polymerase III subunit C11 [Acaromyces ingoldii]PWN89989.1 putative Rpc11-DNA-directed RNA polymerase III subunit C11 [Acaromyces ingoldii]
MSLFCPTCANMLLIGTDDRGLYKWACSTCPYEFPIAKQMTTRVKLTRKDVDDIMGGDDAWKNVDKTAIACPKCDNPEAFFMQLQIRSADEPMTTFYRCTERTCGHQWREG